MRMLTFSGRTWKEILRDPINLGFGLGFPVVLILLLSAIQANVPVPLFEIEMLAPGMTVFGLPFMHAVKLEQAMYAGTTSGVWEHFAWVAGYAVLFTVLAVFAFLRQMNRQ